MQLLLTKEKVWYTIKDTRPAEPTNKWLEDDATALSLIGLNVEDNQLSHIRQEETALKAWNALKKVHEKVTLTNKVSLLRQVYETKLEEGQDLDSHLEKLNEIFMKLIDLEESISEHHKIAIILSSLPKSWHTVVTALEVRKDDELTLTLVQSKLYDEQIRRKKYDVKEEKLLQVTNKKKWKNGQKWKKEGENSNAEKSTSNVFCYFCKKRNHIMKECRKFKDYCEKSKANLVKEEDDSLLCLNEENLFAIESSNEKGWTLDSGATSHIVSDKNLFSNLTTIENKKVKVADGFKVNVHGKGTCLLRFESENGCTSVRLKDVLYVPELKGNFISIRKLNNIGIHVNFHDEKADIIRNNKLLATAEIQNDLFKLQHDKVYAVKEVVNKKLCIHELHRILGHRNIESIKKMLNEELVTGIELKKCQCETQCVVCLQSKMTRKPFVREKANGSKNILDLIHTDLCGPMKTQTHSKKRYLLTFIDDFSRFTKIYLLRNKSEVNAKMMEFVELMKTQFEKKPKQFHSDRGGEYINEEIHKYLVAEGIESSYTSPYTPQLNGVAERKNRSLIEMVRCMLRDAELQRSVWGEAIMTANYLQNRMITSAIKRTPYELWYKRRPQIKSLAVFGSTCFVKVPNNKRTKLDDTSKEMFLLGFDEFNSNIYRCFDREKERIILSRDVIFKSSQNNANGLELHYNSNNAEKEAVNDNDNEAVDPMDYDLSESSKSESSSSESSDESRQPFMRISTRSTKGKQPKRLGYDTNFDQINAIYEPKSYQEVLNDANKEKWIEAMNEEIHSMLKNETWELCDLPPNRQAIGNKWIFTVKTNQNNEVERFKARLVAQGFSQKFGVDYVEVFAPVVKQTTFRILLSIASRMKTKIYQFDVKTAFLNGVINETIYMKQPPGFIVKGKENLVCLLKRSIYGLKQAANSWNEAINQILTTFGYKRCEADNCLYIKINGDDWCIILIYVDDLLVTSSSERMIRKVEKDISSTIEIRSLGEVKNYLKIEVERNDGVYSIKQEKYIKKIVNEFGLENAKISKIPLDSGYEKEQSNNYTFLPSNANYQKLIGSLLYVALNTRPDIAASISILAQKVSKPTEYDWNELKRMVRYLKGTSFYQLKMGSKDQEKENSLIGYADANWAEGRCDRKSNGGYLFKLNGATISWRSKKQDCVALSSTEAELISITDAAKEAIWLRRLLQELHQQINGPTLIFEDNQSCLKIIQNSNASSRTKHIDVRYNFIKDYVKRNVLLCKYCSTEDMIADILTKPLNRTKFEKFRFMIGLVQGKEC